jgi:V/A-type H+-transporting ATPase subunit K
MDDAMMMAALCKVGATAAIACAAVGSAVGTGVAGMAAVGAWKKCYAQSKAAPFLLLVFIGAPLSQTIYGLILMLNISNLADLATYIPADALQAAMDAAAEASSKDWISFLSAEALETGRTALGNACVTWPAMVSAGFLGGIAMAFSAWYQGRAGAAGSDALAETGQGFGNYLMTIGVVETVALFVMIFIQLAI